MITSSLLLGLMFFPSTTITTHFGISYCFPASLTIQYIFHPLTSLEVPSVLCFPKVCLGKVKTPLKLLFLFFSPPTFNYWSIISSLNPEVLVHASSRGFLSCNGSAPMLTMPQRIIIITEKLFLYIYAHQEHRFYNGLHHVMSEV